jgi:DNA-binding GntR family transcriptional regulator
MSERAKSGTAYEAIERMIVMQELEPGLLVSEAQLMQLTQLGRTPVREALQRLARARMVEVHPNRGVLIPSISVEAQLKRLELRRVLEALAVRVACQRARAQEREEMRAMVGVLTGGHLDLAAYMGTVRDTHDLIVRATDNEYFADTMAPLQGLSRRFWLAHVEDEEEDVRTGSNLHVAILKAILDRDSDAAERASLALNDYLTEFAYGTIRRRAV